MLLNISSSCIPIPIPILLYLTIVAIAVLENGKIQNYTAIAGNIHFKMRGIDSVFIASYTYVRI